MAEAELLRDPALVYDILDYRNARMVMDLMKRGDSGAQTLAQNPDMLKIMDKLAMSQQSFDDWREWQRQVRVVRQPLQRDAQPEETEARADTTTADVDTHMARAESH